MIQKLFSLLVSLSIIFFVLPIVGKKIYNLSTRKVIGIYLLTLLGLFFFILIFIDSYDLTQCLEICSIYWNSIISMEILFYFMGAFYLIGGIGFFGSIAEKSGEITEDLNLLSKIEPRNNVKAYFSQLLYGYCFAFGLYSGLEIIFILLGVKFKPQFNFIGNIINYLQFKSIFIYIIGMTLFSIKAFKYGYFSKEFWKYELSYKERRNTWYRYLRKFIVVFFYFWGVYLSILLYYIDYFHLITPFEYNDLDMLLLIFYLSVYIESFYFYTNKKKLIHHLQVKKEDYKVKIDKTIQIAGSSEFEKEKNSNIDENDLKFV